MVLDIAWQVGLLVVTTGLWPSLQLVLDLLLLLLV